MPTIIDALAIELSLDPTKLKKGISEAIEDMRRLKEQAERGGKDVDESNRKTADGFGLITRRIGELAAAYLSFTAIKSFVTDITQQNIALNNQAAALGISVERLSAMNNMARLVGASTQGMGSALATVQQQLIMMNQFGMPPSQNFLVGATRLGIPGSAIYGQNVNAESFMYSAASAAQQRLRSGMSQGAVAELLRLTGFTDPGLIWAMTHLDPSKLREYVKEMQKLAPTPEQNAALRDLNTEWAKFSAKAEAFGRSVVVQMVPALEKALQLMGKMFDSATEHGKFMEKGWEERDRENRKAAGVPVNPPSTDPWGTIGGWFSPLLRWIAPGRARATTRSDDGLGGPSGSHSDQGSIPPRSSYAGPVNRGVIAQQTANQFRGAGLPESGVAAILANIQRESGFNPNSRVADQPRFSGEAHYAHGLYQEGGTEWNNYARWLSKNYPGRSWNDPKLQTEFLIQNLQQHYPKVWSALNDPNMSAGQKAMMFQHGYLRPAVPHYGDVGVAEKFLRNMPPAGSVLEGSSSPSKSWGPFSPMNFHPAMLKSGTNTTNNVSTAETHVGHMTIQTQATDARGLATEIVPMLNHYGKMMAANQIAGGPV